MPIKLLAEVFEAVEQVSSRLEIQHIHRPLIPQTQTLGAVYNHLD
jgi:hypothetical protein